MTQRLPESDIMAEFRLLIAGVACAVEEQGDRAQLEQLQRLLLPRIQHIKAIGGKPRKRDQLVRAVADARETFIKIMGPDWKPRLDTQTARAMKERGVDPMSIVA
ncbi:hypothetical protein [Williamsia sp. D3]|uniref:hypothetical protein n=1 Tax=Williamsia sp. D3 TaxID=1313067 RepID=UPI0003D3A456|nr:hypothetical protein [Williamsia sp. D3]ETD31520.1 hypothetical protein W823_19215 [Williamsia sp. D3]